MCRNEDLLACLPSESPQCCQHLRLQRGVQMGVRLIEKQYVEVRVGGEGVHAEPLQEAAALHHQIALVETRVSLELEAFNRSLDDFDPNVGMVFLAKRGNVEFCTERLA